MSGRNGSAPAAAPAQVILGPEMSVSEALGYVTSGQVPIEAYVEWQAAREAALAARSTAGGGGVIHAKVGRKGGISLYGLNNRMPVTLYAEQWLRLLAVSADVLAFIVARGDGRQNAGKDRDGDYSVAMSIKSDRAGFERLVTSARAALAGQAEGGAA